MKIRRYAVIVTSMLSMMFAVRAAVAMTGGDVVDKLNSDQRSSFVAGAVDMASHMFAVNGDREKARCTLNWFFERESPWPEIDAFFETHRDRDAVAALHVLINRKCGK